MKTNYLFLYPLAVCLLLLNSCSKNSDVIGNPPSDSASLYKIKTITFLSLDPSGQVYDSLITHYTYDNENRPVIADSYQIFFTGGYETKRIIKMAYAGNQAVHTQYLNDDSVVSIQRVYYLKPSTRLLDSAVHKQYYNNVWTTYEKDYYSAYNSDGMAAVADTTAYNAITGELFRKGHTTFLWKGKNILSYTTQYTPGKAYTTSFTYDSSKAPAKTIPGFNFIGYEPVEFFNAAGNFPITKTIAADGITLQEWTFKYTRDELNRVAIQNISLKRYFSASIYTYIVRYTYY
jgi:hypothetical protein